MAQPFKRGTLQSSIVRTQLEAVSYVAQTVYTCRSEASKSLASMLSSRIFDVDKPMLSSNGNGNIHVCDGAVLALRKPEGLSLPMHWLPLTCLRASFSNTLCTGSPPPPRRYMHGEQHYSRRCTRDHTKAALLTLFAALQHNFTTRDIIAQTCKS